MHPRMSAQAEARPNAFAGEIARRTKQAKRASLDQSVENLADDLNETARKAGSAN